MIFRRISIIMLAAAFAAGALARADEPKPVRHLVFAYGVSLSTTSTVHSSGIDDGSASGSTDYRAGNTDTGTIVVDVMAVQPDSGLIVRISEQGRGSRNNDPTMCVAYGTSAVICDMSRGGPNEEEMSLLRVLGRDFVNRAQIDAKNHWRTSAQTQGGDETNDYTLEHTNGYVETITFIRVLNVSGAQPFAATTNGHIVYNEKLSVPVSMTEETVTRKNTGMGNYDRIEQKMSFTLSSDSLAQTAH